MIGFIPMARPTGRCFGSKSKRTAHRMTHLFDPLAIRDSTLANRVFVSPMCEYSSTDGYANDWHFVHLGSRAVGGAGLVLTEATAVLPDRKSTRLNSSHEWISYAVFCLKKKNKITKRKTSR